MFATSAGDRRVWAVVDDGDGRRIVAVVVTFNRKALLERLVERLRDEPRLAEVVVVDNASTDGTGAWLAEQASG